jgi:hypothetical protein
MCPISLTFARGCKDLRPIFVIAPGVWRGTNPELWEAEGS